MSKKIKNSIKRQVVSKSVYSDVFVDQRTRITHSINEESVEKLGQDMKNFVMNNDDVLCAEEICLWLGVLPTEFKRLRDKFEQLETDYQFCLLQLALRRHKGSLTGKYHAATVNFTMPLYSHEWVKLFEMHASFKAITQQQSASNFVIQMNPIQDSSLVPAKKKETCDE